MSDREAQASCKLNELRNTEKREQLLSWWRQLQDSPGNRAVLRRCRRPEDAASHSDAFKVHHILGKFCSIEAAASIAGLLSHIKPESEFDFTSFGKKLAAVKDGSEKPVFSESRFRHLLKSNNWNDFYTQMRRAIVVLDGRIHPLFIADIIMHWDKEQNSDYLKNPGNSLRFRLSQDYYNEIIKREDRK